MSKELLYSCGYCHTWSKSPIIGREAGDYSSKSNHRRINRKCILKKISVDFDSDNCKYFSPANNFYCDKNNHFVSFIVCLNRRFNKKGLDNFEQCKKCRQFDKDIKPILENFWVEGNPVIKSKRRNIKRRENKIDIKRNDKKIKDKRTIKRRKETKIKRTIKRR